MENVAPRLLTPIGMMILFLILLPLVAPAYGSEPSVQEVQAEAVRYSGFDREEMDGWRKKARWAAALPRLQAGFDRNLKDVVRLSTRDNVTIDDGEVVVGPNETDFDQNFDQGTSFEVKAVWYLNELVFSRDSLSVSAERLDWVRERNRVLQEVTEAYFTRKRLLQELRSKSDPPVLRERKKLLLDQATGALDAYTGGWFSRRIEKGDFP